MSTVSLVILNKKKKSGLGLIFLLFGLVIAINYYLRLEICVVCVGIFNLKCLLLECVIPQLGQIYFCKPETGLKHSF